MGYGPITWSSYSSVSTYVTEVLNQIRATSKKMNSLFGALKKEIKQTMSDEVYIPMDEEWMTYTWHK